MYARNLAERKAKGDHKDHLSFFMKELGLDREAVGGMFKRKPKLRRCHLRKVSLAVDGIDRAPLRLSLCLSISWGVLFMFLGEDKD